MRKYLIFLISGLLTLQVWARPIDQDVLDRINAFVNSMIQVNDLPTDISVVISNVHVDEQTELLRSARIDAVLEGNSSVGAGVEITENNLNINLFAALMGSEFGLDEDQIQEFVLMANAFLAQINDAGKYSAKLDIFTAAEGQLFNLEILPVGPGAHPAFERAFIQVVIPADMETSALTISAKLSFNADSALVSVVQTTLTNIMNDLAQGDEPSFEDISALSEVLFELIATVLF